MISAQKRLAKFSFNQFGQGLLEVIVALAIGTALIGALITLSLRSSRTANSSRTENQASKLAEQGVEIVVNILNTNDSKAVWDTGICPGGVVPCSLAATFGNDHNSSNGEMREHLCAPGSTCPPGTVVGSRDWLACYGVTSYCLDDAKMDVGQPPEQITLDTVTYSRVVYLLDVNGVYYDGCANASSPSGLPGPNLSGTNAVQVRVVVSWNDPSGARSRQATSCLTKS